MVRGKHPPRRLGKTALLPSHAILRSASRKEGADGGTMGSPMRCQFRHFGSAPMVRGKLLPRRLGKTVLLPSHANVWSSSSEEGAHGGTMGAPMALSGAIWPAPAG